MKGSLTAALGTMSWLLAILATLTVAVTGCGGKNGNSCTVRDNGDGTKTISCTDGTSVTIDNGKNGISTLISTEVLNVGDSNCPTGGVAVHGGVDTNGNGVLDSSEITSTTYLCNGRDGSGSLPTGILQGSYTIQNSLDEYWITSITAITGDLKVSAPGLTTLSLPALTSVGGNLEFDDNTTLNSISLPALIKVGGSLMIGSAGGNPALTNLDGFAAITDVGFDLHIGGPTGNHSLTSLNGINGIKSIGGELRVTDNTILTSLHGLEAITSVPKNLEISSPALTSLTGLGSIKSVGGGLHIGSAKVLTSLTGLNAIISVGGMLSIDYNDALTSLAGLEAITAVGGNLRISQNAVLTSLTGLDNITSLGGGMEITSNTNLCVSLANALRDLLVAAGWSGQATITGNKDSC